MRVGMAGRSMLLWMGVLVVDMDGQEGELVHGNGMGWVYLGFGKGMHIWRPSWGLGGRGYWEHFHWHGERSYGQRLLSAAQDLA